MALRIVLVTDASAKLTNLQNKHLVTYDSSVSCHLHASDSFSGKRDMIIEESQLRDHTESAE